MANQYELEKEIHAAFDQNRFNPSIPFSGDSECYEISILSDVVKYQPITEYSHERVFERSLNEKEQSKVKERKVKERKETNP